MMLATVAFSACNSEEEATQPTAQMKIEQDTYNINAVSYTHLRAHET